MSKSDRRLRISDLYNAIGKAIEDFKTQWVNSNFEIASEDYFKALDSAISDIEVDSGLYDARQVWKEEYEKECEARMRQSYYCKTCGVKVTIKDVDDFEIAKQFGYCGEHYHGSDNWGNE